MTSPSHASQDWVPTLLVGLLGAARATLPDGDALGHDQWASALNGREASSRTSVLISME